MKRRRHTPEQIIRTLREAERLLGEGRTMPEAAKELEISEQTCHRRRMQYGGMKADDAKRLKELERENRQLRAIVADQALENRALKEFSRGNWQARPAGVRRSRCFATASASASAGYAGWSGSIARPSAMSRSAPRTTRRYVPSCIRARLLSGLLRLPAGEREVLRRGAVGADLSATPSRG